ncbi:helix-turn-helix domain-containing protein [Methylotenera sp. L2L1]|jgi:transcriptional regulator with XRE-family HTH domain|uniref:helix-turn-helix domain-containing protein n=1 Tax=Methylotenera sp. L2L1 TaxID=1502770 RepID=UPI00068EBB06|nr:helix-turn-helix domain-containing protein [Methylotenera sp. L2L1]
MKNMNSKLFEIDSTHTLGQAIRKRRKEMRLTMDLAAPLCGVSVPFLQALETGKSSAHLGKAIQVANMLGLKIFVQE